MSQQTKQMTQHAHPNIFTAIQMFKDVQNCNVINRIQRAAGGTTRPKTQRYLNIDRRLIVLKEKYQTGVIDLMTYVDSTSQLIQLGA